MEEVTTKIHVIEAILASPTKYPDKTREERLEKLKERFPDSDSLFTYFDFEKKEVQELLKELKRKENLFQEERNKQLGSSAGNHIKQ